MDGNENESLPSGRAAAGQCLILSGFGQHPEPPGKATSREQDSSQGSARVPAQEQNAPSVQQ